MDPARPRSMFTEYARGTQDVSARTQLVGRRLRESIDEVIDGMNRAIESAIDELDQDVVRIPLHASVANNVEVIVTMLIEQRDVTELPPVPAATAYAVALARNNVSAAALRRAYHIGSDHLLAHIFDVVQDLDCGSAEKLRLFHYLAGWTYKYVDAITRTVMSAYEQELRASRANVAHTAAASVERVLNEHDVDLAEFRTATGYELAQVHVGGLMWIGDTGAAADQIEILTSLAHRLGERIGSSTVPLVTAIDRTSVRVWFGRKNDPTPITAEQMVTTVDTMVGARVALGSPARGPSGFRATAQQAEQIAIIPQVSRAVGAHVVSHADEAIPMIALAAADIEATRRWVLQVLGPLAAPSEAGERQRATLRAYFDSGGNITETAKSLVMHRNSVKYRLDRAQQELGRTLHDRTLDTRIALSMCRTLGTAVLTPADA
ncbi:PucR family transcriptional regulator [Aeromicrobium sp. CTD01-1L150]|uniref:PucR family transcriptional regulator n=1 Tax=Aeromicrobium sp. CTD01-1L150 TaxID=3341830 RepID=UPI0035BEFB71